MSFHEGLESSKYKYVNDMAVIPIQRVSMLQFSKGFNVTVLEFLRQVAVEYGFVLPQC